MPYSFSQLGAAAEDLKQKAIDLKWKEMMAMPDSHPTDGGAQFLRDAQKQFADVPSWFAPYTSTPDPAAYQPMIDDLTYALGNLCMQSIPDPIDRKMIAADSRLGQWSLIQQRLGEWTGPAANQFEETFTAPFPQHTSNMFTLCALLKSSMEAYRDYWKSARTDITSLINGAIGAVEHGPVTMCSSNEWTMTWTVLIAVVGIASADLEGLAAYVGASIGGVFSVTQAAYTPPESQYGGNDADSIMSSIHDAVRKHAQNLVSEEQKIVTALASLQQAAADSSLYLAPTPEFVGATHKNIHSLLGDGK